MKKIILALFFLFNFGFSETLISWFSNFNIYAIQTNVVEYNSSLKIETNLYYFIYDNGYEGTDFLYDMSYTLTVFETYYKTYNKKFKSIIYVVSEEEGYEFSHEWLKAFYNMPAVMRGRALREMIFGVQQQQKAVD